MWELFIIGTFWFWALVAIEFIALLVFIENEWPGWALFSIIGTFCLLHWCGNLSLITYITANPWMIGIGAIIYILVGAPWGCLKWWFHLRNLRERYIEIRHEWFTILPRKIKRGNEPEAEIDAYKEVVAAKKITENAKEYWQKYVEDTYGYEMRGGKFQKPLLRHNKRRIILWMGYWPFSMLWTVINDPVRKLFRQVYHSFEGVLQQITDRVWRDIDEELGESD